MDFEKIVMGKVTTNKIVMKPKWYFFIGSFLMGTSFVGLSMGAIFLTNLTLFLLRKHGPMGEWRLQMMLDSFPWWILIFAILGMILGIWILKKYDISYKKNFTLLVIGFIFSIITSAFILDLSGINDVWSHQGPMRNFYQQMENPNSSFQKGPGWRRNGQN